MFRYYFFSIWRDKAHRSALAERPELRQSLIQSSASLFDETEASGLVLEDFGAKNFYLVFAQPSTTTSANIGGGNRENLNFPQDSIIQVGVTPTPGSSINYGATPQGNGVSSGNWTPMGPQTAGGPASVIGIADSQAMSSGGAFASIYGWHQESQEEAALMINGSGFN